MALTLVYQFPVTIPAGTTQAAPLVTPTTFEPNEVERIEWLFPHGCNGLVGIRIGARAVPILPSGAANWFITSGMIHGLDVADMPNSGDWSIIGYNLGANPHTIHVTFRAHRKEKDLEPFMLIPDAVLSNFPLFPVAPHG